MELRETANYILSLAKFRNQIPEDLRPSWVKMSTITMLSRFDCDLDVERIEKAFKMVKKIRLVPAGSKDLRFRFVVSEKGVKFNCEAGGIEWRRKYTSFYNQVSLTYTDSYSTKSVKVFPNGTVHVTGCTNLFECRDVMEQVKTLFQIILNWSEPIPFSDPQILMINSNFSLNCEVDQYELIDRLRQHKMFKITFTPEKYSAVKVKFKPLPDMKLVTVMIFRTGNIVINGAVTLKEVAYAYKVINKHLTAGVRQDKNEVVNEHNMFMGASFERWVEVLKKTKVFDTYE
jgi:TATA-box binding protein (TBP) (component of TFIID and TFIIIB)